ncbi:MAG: type II secretion system protein [Candidatus Wallbacteria bacterium]|nr:type II secretion system protein [Candidatus Wallbacteria bacterium]
MQSGLTPKGFTLAGICVAILIVGISARAAFPVYGMIAKNQKEEELKFMLRQFSRAIFLYLEQNKKNPGTLDELFKARLLRQKYVNPFLQVKDPKELKGFEGFRSIMNSKNLIENVSPSLDKKPGFPDFEKYNSWYYKATRKNSIICYTFHGSIADDNRTGTAEITIETGTTF